MRSIFLSFFLFSFLWSFPEIGTAQSLLNIENDKLVRNNLVLGRKLFNRDWQPYPGLTPDGDGLGPVFNRVSCIGCHFQAGRGRPPEGPTEPFTSMVLRLGFTDNLGSRGHIAYGEQINDRSLPHVPAEGRPSLQYEKVNGQFIDGTRYSLRMPRYQVEDLAFGKLGWAIKFSGRVAQPLLGIGFLEAIPESDIRAMADPDDLNKDGVSGRAANIMDARMQRHLGRFGWKASKANLFTQTAQALHEDMGLTNPVHQDQNCMWEQLACRTVAKQIGLEVTASQLDQLVSFQRALAPAKPQARNELGRVLFRKATCDNCHTPSWILPKDIWPNYLANQTIYPYTDLLLHDMGQGLSDGLFHGDAEPNEWRTAPLWGISARQPLRLLHDGRARSIEEAILWHDGEGRDARDLYRALPLHERQSLVDFVSGL